jgi:hypothetical protein
MITEYIPDPIEIGEDRMERWMEANCDGDTFTCRCGAPCPLACALPSSPDPYSEPICPACAVEDRKP